MTEKIPCSNLRIFPYLILRTPSQARFARQLSHRESQGRLRRRECKNMDFSIKNRLLQKFLAAALVVDLIGIEPTTLRMRTVRSPS